jgi:hypothetical protein
MPPLIDPNLSIAESRQIVVGGTADWTLGCPNRDGSMPAFDPTDTVSAKLYTGLSNAILFSPPCAWKNPTPDGTVVVSPQSSQTTTLEPNGDYILQVWWANAAGTRKACIRRCQVVALPAPGLDVPTIQPYITLADILDVASWVSMIQNMNADTEGFYKQRLKARQWFDWCVINSYTGGGVGSFGYASMYAFAWGGGGGLISQGPSRTMIDYLAANKLIIRPQVTLCCAHRAAYYIAMNQMGVNNQMVGRAAYHCEEASRELVGTTAEIDTNADGYGEIYVNLSSTATRFT